MCLESLSTWNVQFILVREALVRDPTAQAVAAPSSVLKAWGEK